ncbi:MAG: N-formylglutamate deformylase [Burkholderiales bacterium]|nr:N-formylglutamate deformylase [Burkholderiales bacterium]
MSELYTLQRGRVPLLVSAPHAGTWIPDELAPRLTERALAVEDTDWFVDRLWAFTAGLGASLIVPKASRYVVDLNRPSDNRPMYAGRNNTELCPTRHFTGDAIYRAGQAPDAAEIRARVATYWQPYHDALAAEIERLCSVHGHVVLFDAHSIKSELPWLFEGLLPQLNLGTVEGTSCAATLRDALGARFAAQRDYTWVVDGRFKGGHITRHYGRPAARVHAVQLEMAWSAYMDEAPPYRWHEERAAAIAPLLHAFAQTMIDWRPA